MISPVTSFTTYLQTIITVTAKDLFLACYIFTLSRMDCFKHGDCLNCTLALEEIMYLRQKRRLHKLSIAFYPCLWQSSTMVVASLPSPPLPLPPLPRPSALRNSDLYITPWRTVVNGIRVDYTPRRPSTCLTTSNSMRTYPTLRKGDPWNTLQKQSTLSQGWTAGLYLLNGEKTTPVQPILYLSRCFILRK